MSGRFWPTSGVIAVVFAVILTWQVHSRFGNETFTCSDTGECMLGSGASWLLTGATLIGPFLTLLGAAWSRRLHYENKLGPFSYRAIPDGEQILETLAVLSAGLFTYWFIRNGPSIDPARPLDITIPNTWALDIRNVRLPDGVTEVTSVPTRLSWFIIGMVLSAPFAFSFGTMLGREFYGRRRRVAQRDSDERLELDDTVNGSTTIDLTKSVDLDELDFDVE